MILIRLIAAAATATALALAVSPASARSCEDSDTACSSGAAQAAPMKLDQFMNTWKPVAVSKHTGKSKSARRRAAREAVAESKSKPAAKAEQTEAKAEPAAVETAPPAAATPSAVAIGPEPAAETDGVAVTSFNQQNELDAKADQVQVMAFNEINELDLAAPAPPPPAETTGQSVAAEPVGSDTSWIGKLLLAAAGTIALAGAARFLVA